MEKSIQEPLKTLVSTLFSVVCRAKLRNMTDTFMVGLKSFGCPAPVSGCPGRPGNQCVEPCDSLLLCIIKLHLKRRRI